MGYLKKQHIRWLNEKKKDGLKWPEIQTLFNETFNTDKGVKSLYEAWYKRRKSVEDEAVSHLLIPDVQMKPGAPTDHLVALGKLIVDRQPEVIVNIGDFWDMESLSSYDVGKKCEGRRVKADIDCGNEAIAIINDAIDSVPHYVPRKIFTLGNHEQRIERHVNANPHLIGFLGYDQLDLEGWELFNFLTIAEVDGVHYSHYFPNPLSGRPIGGTADNRLNKLGFSFTQGHEQSFKYARRDLSNGAVIHGLVAGAFYTHDEDYKGPQGNHHFRGVVYKHNVKDGDYDVESISIRRLMEEYK